MFGERDYELRGRRLKRDRHECRVVDPKTGEELSVASGGELVEDVHGLMDGAEIHHGTLLACGHVWFGDHRVATCEVCSRKSGHAEWICSKCSASCGICGRVLCKKHSSPALDLSRHCPGCVAKANRIIRTRLEMQRKLPRGSSAGPLSSVVRGASYVAYSATRSVSRTLSRLLEWW